MGLICKLKENGNIIAAVLNEDLYSPLIMSKLADPMYIPHMKRLVEPVMGLIEPLKENLYKKPENQFEKIVI